MIAERVERLLRESKAARNDDNVLYARYITKYHPKLKHVELVDAFKHLEKYGLPSFKSVGRARQKLQVKYPELKGDK
jgi:hypothetical protein